MKKLIYYITDHGKGHATRSVAIIRELQRLNIEIIVRNSNVVKFLQESLPNNLIISGITDVGPDIKSDLVSIDEISTKNNISKWIKNLENTVKSECEKVSNIHPDLIISDISIMPFLVANKIKTQSIAISNFSWYDVLKMLPDTDLEIIKNSYDFADLAIQLPIGTSMEHFRAKNKVGFVCRIPQKSKEELRKELGIKDSDYVVLMSLGNSNYKIKCSIDKNIKILAMNASIKNNDNVVSLSDPIESQNLVLASDFVICKCGYGMISECLTNGIPFNYVVDHNHLEQKAMSEELTNRNLATKITFDEINDLVINEEFIHSRSSIPKMKVDTNTVKKIILEFLQ